MSFEPWEVTMDNWLDKYLRAKPGAEHDYKLEWQWDLSDSG